ncbi:hypothetical protein HDU97_001605 [Phlyctochytrium planicorne]|nr:hypothetical protein HDU97_001605 [Phlyctochytrium planicorne]
MVGNERSGAADPKPSPPPPTASVIVGYKEEKKQLSAALKGWLKYVLAQEEEDKKTSPGYNQKYAGHCGVVLVEGQSGIGKSTLVESFISYAKEIRISLCLNRISKENQLTPFSGIANTIRYIIVEDLIMMNKWRGQKVIRNGANDDDESERLSRKSSHTLAEWSTGPILITLTNDAPMDRTDEDLPPLRYNPQKQDAAPKKTPIVTPESLTLYLIRMNQDPSLCPLLSVIFQNLRMEPTEVTRNLTPFGAGKTLMNLVQKLFLGWCERKRGSDRRTVFVYDDFQLGDIESYLIAKFSQYGYEDIQKVDDTVLSVLRKRIANSPLILDLSVEALKKMELFAVEDGVLIFRDSGRKLSDLLESSLSTIIIDQYKRLGAKFQEILESASILGQYFNLYDIMAIMPGKKNAADLAEIIATEDAFGYLRLANEDMKQQEDEEDDDSSQGESIDPAAFSYFFRHISVVTAIYESIPSQKKSELHRSVGRLLESNMDPSNEMSLLPLVYHHFSLSNDVKKHFDFGERLGLHYESKGFRKEARQILNNLVESFPEQLKAGHGQGISRHRQATWFATLASIDAYDYKSQAVMENALKALRLLKLKILEQPNVTSKIVSKSIIQHFKLFMKTRGGRKGPRLGRTLHEEEGEIQRLICADKALTAIFHSMLVNVKISKEYRAYITFEGLNNSIMICDAMPSAWVMRCFILALALMLKNPKLAKLYFKCGMRNLPKCKFEDISGAHIYLLAYLHATRQHGLFKKYMNDFESVAVKQGNIPFLQSLTVFKIMTEGSPANFEEAENLLLPLLENTQQEDLYVADSTRTYLLLYAVSHDRPDKIREIIGMMEAARNRVEDFETLPVSLYSTEKYGYAWLAIKNNDLENAMSLLTVYGESLLANETPTFTTITGIFAGFAMWAIMITLGLMQTSTAANNIQGKLSYFYAGFKKASMPYYVATQRFASLYPNNRKASNFFLASASFFKSCDVSLFMDMGRKEVISRWRAKSRKAIRLTKKGLADQGSGERDRSLFRMFDGFGYLGLWFFEGCQREQFAKYRGLALEMFKGGQMGNWVDALPYP